MKLSDLREPYQAQAAAQLRIPASPGCPRTAPGRGTLALTPATGGDVGTAPRRSPLGLVGGRPGTAQNLAGRGLEIPPGPAGGIRLGRGPGRGLNKTESRFLADWPPDPTRPGLILPQALVLWFDDGTRYCPDFLWIVPGFTPRVVEIKGGHVGRVAWSRHGIERYRRARDVWSRFFVFELWTWSDGSWKGPGI
jgi:hypothetical protein